MIPVVEKIAESLRAEGIEPGGSEVMTVAFSGGADSMALLVAMVRGGYAVRAAHCNFHLRGEESDRDALLARRAAARFGVEFLLKDFDARGYAAAHGISIEMACRELRYEWFRQLGGLILVAHHRQDRVETLLLNLMRGTGVRGLASMRRRSGNILRPMLDCTRAEIEALLAEEGLEYAVDSTNASDEFMRNRLRLHVLPALVEAFPDALRGISRSMDCIEDDVRVLDVLLASQRDTPLRDMPDDIARHVLVQKGFSHSVAEQIVASRCSSGLIFHDRHGEAFLLNRGELVPYTPEGAMPRIVCTVIDRAQWEPLRDNRVADFDDALLRDRTVEIRPWRVGDRLLPFGMRGSRLVSDLLSDAKVSVVDKCRVPILTIDGEPAWVAGLRRGRQAPVTEKTRLVRRYTLKDR